MIDLREHDERVALMAVGYREAESAFGKAREAMRAEMDSAFGRLCRVAAGDHIRLGRLEGRAVILRDGFKAGLYLDQNGQRHRIDPDQYRSVVVIPRHTPRLDAHLRSR